MIQNPKRNALEIRGLIKTEKEVRKLDRDAQYLAKEVNVPPAIADLSQKTFFPL